MIEQAISQLRRYVRGVIEDTDPNRMEVIVRIDPMSPWLLIDFTPAVASYQARDLNFAVWKSSGAVHRVIEGEVQDPELFHVQ